VTDVPPACHCVLCHDYGDRDNRDPVQTATVRNVEEHGWSVLMIPADEHGPGFAYTIGLWHSHRAPELAMFGLDVEVMKSCLNDLGTRAAGGELLAAEQAYDDVIESYPVRLKPIVLTWCNTLFGRTIGFYRRPPIPFLQVLWPDRDGRFMWDAGSDDALRRRQPQLWLAPGEHPPGVWAQDM
jgi:hypothetical protein